MFKRKPLILLFASVAVLMTSALTQAQVARFRWMPQRQRACPPCQPVQQNFHCPPSNGYQNVQPIPAQPQNGNSNQGGQSSDGTGNNGGTGDNPTQPQNDLPDLSSDQMPQANSDSFAASDQFAGGESMGASDITIGDFFNNPGIITGPTFGQIPVNSPIAGGDRRYKMSDHFSPLPINRVYFSYHDFVDPVSDLNGNQIDVQRYTMGLEKTFWNGAGSFEVRMPFSHGLSNVQNQDLGNPQILDATEFGNITLATKFLMQERCNYAWSAGVALTIPTASDAELIAPGAPVGTGDPAVIIENEAYNLHPFMALYVRPNNCSWMTFSTQMDFNLEGNSVISLPNTLRESSAKFNDQNLLSFDMTMGRWFYRNQCRGRMIRGVAGIIELHYTTSMNDSDIVQAGQAGDTFTNPLNRIDVFNLTAGLRFQVRDNTFVTLAGVAPLKEIPDRQFDSEFNLNITRTY